MIEKDIERIAVASERIATALEALVGTGATNAFNKKEATEGGQNDTPAVDEKAKRKGILAELTAMKVAFDKKQPTEYLEKVLMKAKAAAPAPAVQEEIEDPFNTPPSRGGEGRQLDFLGNEEEEAPEKERVIFSYEAAKTAATEYIKRYGDDTTVKKLIAESGKTKLPDMNDEERTDFVEKLMAISREKEIAKAGASATVRKAK
jgi:hypothetical protein